MASPVSNVLLDHLPPATRASLFQHLEAVPLPSGTILFEPEQQPRYLHFMTSGMASIIAEMSDGSAVEVGVIGREGVVQVQHLLGSVTNFNKGLVQIPGTALRMDFQRFQRDFYKDEVQRAVLRFAQYQTQVLSQIAACNRLHEVEERLARWLLMVADRIDSTELALTQSFLGTMLGARRSTVTLIAGTLQRSGLITYHRGSVQLLDREGIENTACECYPVTRKLLQELIKPERV